MRLPVRLVELHRRLFDRPERGGSGLLPMVIALMLSFVSRLPMVGLRMDADKTLVVSRRTSAGRASIVPAFASPRPLTAVCG